MANEKLGLVDATTGVEVPDADARYRYLAPTIVVGSADSGDAINKADYIHDNGLGVDPYNDAIAEALADPRITNGGVIYVRAGTYLFPNRLTQYVVPSGISIVGEGMGSTIFEISGNNNQRQIPMFDFDNVNNCELIDLSFKWTAPDWSPLWGIYFFKFNYAVDCIMRNIEFYADAAKDFDLGGSFPCIIQNGAGTRVTFDGLRINTNGNISGECSLIHTWASDTIIRDCHLYGTTARAAIWVQGGKTTVEGNIIKNSTTLAGLDAQGVHIDADANVSRVIISDNYFETGGICVELSAYSGSASGNNIDDVIISNNMMLAYRAAIKMEQDRSFPYDGTQIRNVVVEGNEIQRPDFLLQLDSDIECIEVDCLGFTIANNIIDMANSKGSGDPTLGGHTHATAIIVYNSRPAHTNEYSVGGVIEGNRISFGSNDPTFYPTQLRGISIFSNHCIVNGNSIRICHSISGPFYPKDCIGISYADISGGMFGIVSNNSIEMEVGDTAATYSACIYVNAGTTGNESRVTIIGNTCRLNSEGLGPCNAFRTSTGSSSYTSTLTLTGNVFEVLCSNPASKTSVDAVIGAPGGDSLNQLGVTTGNSLIIYGGATPGDFWDFFANLNFTKTNNRELAIP